jgi:AcrR family transcriptional regulator
LETDSPDESADSPRLSRQAWLEQALVAIGRRGKGWVGIHDLVKDLGVSKGSFYWHFRNREEFVEALLDYWVGNLTAAVPEMIEAKCGSPKDRLLALMDLISSEKLNRLDIAIRSWALREPKAAAAVKKSDRIRLDYVGSLFREMGFEGDELEMRTRTFVIYFSFEAAFSHPEPVDDRKRLMKLRSAWLVKRE